MSLVIYHNPRCSKSRQTLELIQSRGHEPRIVHYLDTPPEAGELRWMVRTLGVGIRDLMRTKEHLYRELGLDNRELGEPQLIEAIIAHPVLLERPLVVHGERVALGRPPEKVLEIL